MICLGIEGTAHTFAAAVVSSKGEILSDVRDTYTTESGGIIPMDAARHHEAVCHNVIKKAIAESREKKIDFVAFSRGPGLGPCLRIAHKSAVEYAEELRMNEKVLSVVGVNHCIAHLTSGTLFTKAKNPVYVYVSGANTQIIALESGRFRIFGETLDIGLGNALDKFGRAVGLGFPAGSKIENLAKYGKYIPLPYSMKGMDLAFSGIITDCINKFSKGVKKEDLCFSIQEHLFAMLIEVSERALAHCQKNEVLLIGGVAANKRLCEMFEIMCKERSAKFNSVPLKYAGDNAVMIAWQGLLEYNAKAKGKQVKLITDIRPYERTDEVGVAW